jgi:signal transduction histidine kinase
MAAAHGDPDQGARLSSGGSGSLRGALSATTLLVTLLALVVATALVLLTSMFHRVVETMGAAVESVRLMQEAQADLLLHPRAGDPVVRRDYESTIRLRLDRARIHVTTTDEAQMLDDAEAAVIGYVTVVDAAAPAEDVAYAHDRAFVAMRRLVDVNVQQSRDAARLASEWDTQANVLGLGAGTLVLAIGAGLLWWLRARAFRPLLGLAAAMRRFGAGERDARAAPTGPRELVEMSAQFNEMATALAAQRDAQMAFLASVAHDLRTPLGAVSMSVGLLDPDAAPVTAEHRRWAIEVARRQVRNLERMIGDLLDVTRIEAGDLSLRLERCDVGALTRTAVEWFQEGLSTITLEVPDTPVPVQCDPTRTEQVIANLVSNARKYSPEGGSIRVTLVTDGADAVLSVADEGIGMTQDELGRLFRPFARVGPARGKIPGIGLGLFVVRRIVEAHRGRIDLQSVSGVGSTFRVVLPIARGDEATRAVPPEPPAAGH